MLSLLKTKRIYLAALLILVACAALQPATGRTTEGVGADDENIEKLAVKRVQPTYPPSAQRYKIEGIVTVHVTVDKSGKVDKAEFVRGHNIFRSVSLDAAKRWEFKRPDSETLGGTINFTFKLSG
jgi:TonB family protein